MALTDNMTQDDETQDRRALLAQMQGGPLATAQANNTGVRTPSTATPVPAAAPPAAAPAPAAPPAMDNSKWDTDGYSKPGYTAADTHGTVLYDPAKWNDANHQTPKYVVGRIMAEAGDMKDPNARTAAFEKIAQAYPGATYNGKDKLTMPDGGIIDVFKGAGSGEYGIQWNPETGPGGKPLEGQATPGSAIPTQANEQMNSYVPTDMSTYNALQARLKEILGGDAAMNKEALLSQMVR
jgi:hypothetical protein